MSTRAFAFALGAAVVAAVLARPEVAAAQARDAQEQDIELVVGQQTVVSARDVAKYSEGTPGVVEVRLPQDASDFVIVALAPGMTTLLLLMRDGRRVRYRIRVTTGPVERRDNIRLDFYFVQLDERSRFRVGIGWPGSVAGTATFDAQYDLVGGGLAATASVVAQALPRIDLAHSRGWARIRRHATVVMANGETGRFASGGETNFRVEGNLSSSIQSIPFGTDISVRARYDDGSGRIEIKIAAEVSDLTDAGVDGVPGRTVSRVETLINLEIDQAIVLAGLSAEASGHTRGGLPWLSQIPVLGALFGTSDSRAEATENLVFIIPTLIEASSLEERDLVSEALEAYQAFEGDLQPAALPAADGPRKEPR